MGQSEGSKGLSVGSKRGNQKIPKRISEGTKRVI
jgi:hypothetical protein